MANMCFVENNLREHWLEINTLREWTGMDGALRLAAQDAGMEVTRISGRDVVHKGTQIHGLFNGTSMGSMNSASAINIAKSKNQTKALLSLMGLPTPAGTASRSIEATEVKDALTRFSQQGKRCVIKPNDGAGGRGISTNVDPSAKSQVNRAWSRAIGESPSRQALIEEETAGVDTRFYCIKGEIVAIAARVPAFVVGDGTRSIKALVALLQEARQRNAYLVNQGSLNVDHEFLASQNFQTSSILEPNSVAFLNGTANIHAGGLNVDITKVVHNDLVSMARRVANNLPGFGCGAVDLLATSPTGSGEAVVLEVNTHANLSVNQFTAYGEPPPVATHIIRAIAE